MWWLWSAVGWGGDVPKGWMLAGDASALYAVDVVEQPVRDGSRAVRLSSRRRKTGGFGTLMQVFVPHAYQGQRVRFRAWLKTSDVVGWAGVWVRVDGADDTGIAFDNMQDRPLRGTTDWTRCEVVLDIDEQAASVSFGALLSGAGTVWIDAFTIDPVGEDVPVTDLRKQNQPKNLNFE